MTTELQDRELLIVTGLPASSLGASRQYGADLLESGHIHGGIAEADGPHAQLLDHIGRKHLVKRENYNSLCKHVWVPLLHPDLRAAASFISLDHLAVDLIVVCTDHHCKVRMQLTYAAVKIMPHDCT